MLLEGLSFSGALWQSVLKLSKLLLLFYVYSLANCKKIFMLENQVLEELAQRALADCRQKTEQLRKAEFILRVPRIHHKYLNEHGTDIFIEKFSSNIAEMQAIKEEQDRHKKRINLRQSMSQRMHNFNSKTQIHQSSGIPLTMELLLRKQYEDINELIHQPKPIAKTDWKPAVPIEFSTLPPSTV